MLCDAFDPVNSTSESADCIFYHDIHTDNLRDKYFSCTCDNTVTFKGAIIRWICVYVLNVKLMKITVINQYIIYFLKMMPNSYFVLFINIGLFMEKLN